MFTCGESGPHGDECSGQNVEIYGAYLGGHQWELTWCRPSQLRLKSELELGTWYREAEDAFALSDTIKRSFLSLFPCAS